MSHSKNIQRMRNMALLINHNDTFTSIQTSMSKNVENINQENFKCSLSPNAVGETIQESLNRVILDKKEQFKN